MGKSFWECLKPNKINLILMIVSYGIWYASGVLLYSPLNSFYFSMTQNVEPNYTDYMTSDYVPSTPIGLSIITVLIDLLVFYFIGSFAYWLVYYFKE